LSAFPIPGETVTIDQFGTIIYWVKLQIPQPINPEHVIVEVIITRENVHLQQLKLEMRDKA